MEDKQPKGDTLRQADMLKPSDFDLMEKRLADVEARLSADNLGWEAEYRKELLREVQQRINMRERMALVAGVVMVFMAVLAWCGLSTVVASLASTGASGGALKVGLFVAPVVSITAITVMLLVGAFKRPKDEPEVNVPAMVFEGMKGMQS